MKAICLNILLVWVLSAHGAYYGSQAVSDPSCPVFFTSFGDSCYRFVGHAMRWGAAEAHCQTFFSAVGTQGHLVSIQSNAENAFVYELWRSSRISPPKMPSSYNRFDSVWVGLSDIAVEGNYRWSDGSALTYRKWSSGEPNGSHDNDDCTHMMDIQPHAPGTWNDIDCGHSGGLPFICKLKMTRY